MATGFVSTAWLARMLGPEAYGILGFGTAFVSYFALAVVFGTDLYGTREIASSPEKMPALLSRILGARLILLLLVGVIYIGVISGIDRPRDVIIVMFIQILGLLSAAMTVILCPASWTLKKLDVAASMIRSRMRSPGLASNVGPDCAGIPFMSMPGG